MGVDGGRGTPPEQADLVIKPLCSAVQCSAEQRQRLGWYSVFSAGPIPVLQVAMVQQNVQSNATWDVERNGGRHLSSSEVPWYHSLKHVSIDRIPS